MMLGQPHAKEWNWTPILHYMCVWKLIQKLMTDLNMRPEIIKILEKKTGSKHLEIGHGEDFLDLTPKRQKCQK